MIYSLNKRHILSSLIILAATLSLLLIPDYFVNPVYQHNDREKVQILSVDNSLLKRAALITYGEQICQVQILSGKFDRQKASAVNMLTGSLETDKLFTPGDQALALISHSNQGETLNSITLIDHYRIELEVYLIVAFALLLICVAGWIGFRAILSFIFSVLAIWKLLIPAILLGYNPILVGLVVTLLMTITIIILVYGPNRLFLSAISGSLLGTLITSIIAIYFVAEFKIHGAIMNYSESLLYSGYPNINLTDIFIASIFIASSGAVMDVAVDITAAVNEVIEKKTDITAIEAIKSGMNVGRAVIGTMTTTLLLAYSGGYIALLIVFVAQGTPIINILNLNFVAAEILHTMVGSFGLILVVPFTALTSGLLLTHRKNAP